MPSILALLLTGFVAGPITGYLRPDALLDELLFPIVSIAVAIILFEGGLSLQFKEIRKVGSVVRNLLSIGVLITWVASTALAVYIFNMNIGVAILLGAILTVTGPTVIGPLLRHIRPTGRATPILKWEGIIVDPIGAVLAVLVFEVIVVSPAAGGDLSQIIIHALWIITRTILVGGGAGVIGALFIILVFRRDWVPDFLHNPVTLMILLGVYLVSELAQKEAGLLATTVMGMALANQKRVDVRHIIEFKENLRTLLISSLFILLAARVDLEVLMNIDLRALLFLLGLLFLVRPLAVFFSTIGSELTARQKIFLAWMAPRGIVAAAVASIFGLRLAEDASADLLVSIVFTVIVGTIAVYGLTAGWLARLLGLAGSNPQGLLIVGAHYWSRLLARLLMEKGIRLTLVDTNIYNLSVASSMGLNVREGNILDEYVVDRLELEGIGRLLALTPNDEVNALAALRFSNIFGRKNVFQISPFRDDSGQAVEVVSRELRGRCLFTRQMTFNRMNRAFRDGNALIAYEITRELNFDAIKKRHANYHVEPLFQISQEGRLNIFTAFERPEIRNGHTLIILLMPLEPGSENSQSRTDD